VTTLGHFVEL